MTNEQQTIPESISLKLASPDVIMKWSHGEVQKPETINYRTGRSERGGLFDERIFGPEKDYECYCGKYRRIRYKDIICEKCGVEVTRSVVRRERMGHIELASPVAHIWLLRGVPSRMSLFLGIPVTQLEKVIYFAGYIVTLVDQEEKKRVLKDVENEYKLKLKSLDDEKDQDRLTELFKATKKEIQDITERRVLSEVEYYNYSVKYSTVFEAGIGAEAIYKIFKETNLEELAAELEAKVAKSEKLAREKLERRLSLVRSMIKAGIKAEWMFLSIIPVIPPALRPMVALEGGRHATSDVNDLYRRVINRNNRLKKLLEIHAPDVILRNEKRILQEAVDSLIDNSIRKHSGTVAMSQSQRRTLKSLSDNLKGKQGLFRQNLLGKRVDYSGRSVIVVGPSLKLNECGLPKYMALELFRPFVISKVIERELAYNIRGAGKLIEEATPEVWEILEEVIQGKFVLLNRAPTLHRLSIQAFNPVLIEGKAIQVHPLVCSAFNADFDGDQMAVHVPLSKEAQLEARELIAANKNLLKPQTGDPIATPTQGIVLGCYWMTTLVEGSMGEDKIFSSPNEAIMAYDFGQLDFRAKIKVMPTETARYAHLESKVFETSVGRLLFNSILPKDYPFVNREVKKKDISHIVQDLIDIYGMDAVPAVLDKIKTFGYKYATVSGTTLGFTDAKVPEGKKALVEEGKIQAKKIREEYQNGLISDSERYWKIISLWEGVRSDISSLVEKHFHDAQSVYDMVTSGAKGSVDNMTQMAGMKGIIVNTKGESLDFPIIPSMKEGLSPIEYFITTHGARKGLADTALSTAKAGYLTRRLVDVAQDIVITELDCKTKKGVIARAINADGIERSLAVQLKGRVLGTTVKSPDGKQEWKKGTLVDKHIAAVIDESGVEEVLVRSPLTCETLHGICQQCYGLDLGRNKIVKYGEAVGVVAAQAIGEPGTQLTLRTFHAGGVAGRDITQGLPRVDEVFERRNPKAPATVCKASGMISDIIKGDDGVTIHVLETASGKTDKSSQTTEYVIDARRVPIVAKGDEVKAGDQLTDGSANILQVFEFGGAERAQMYIINEINKVYDLQGASTAPKHLEIIVRQMFSRRKITKPGDTRFTTGEVVEFIEFTQENERVAEEGGMIATAAQLVLGISEVSLSTKSWLSSASFQHTTRTLIANAIRGEKDGLRGLKENVIIGNLIPAGTGLNDEFIPMSELYENEPEESLGLDEVFTKGAE